MLTKKQRYSLSAAARFFDKRAKIVYKCGKVYVADKFANWAKLIRDALSIMPMGCAGCKYEYSQNGRCVDCRRVANRVDNYRSK